MSEEIVPLSGFYGSAKARAMLERARKLAGEAEQAEAMEAAAEQQQAMPKFSTDALNLLFKNSNQITDFSKLKPSVQKAPTRFESINVNLTELFSNQPKRLRIVRKNRCNQCDGKRTQKELDFTCPECKGSGSNTLDNSAFDFYVPYRRSTPCKTCNQTGVVIPEEHYCWCCLGQGLLDEPVTIEVPLAGANPRNPIIVKGEGDESLNPQIARGDVEIVVKLLEHRHWTAVDQFLYCEKKVWAIPTLLGKCWSLATIDGQSLNCRTSAPPVDRELLINQDKKLFVRLIFVYPETFQQAQIQNQVFQEQDGIVIFEKLTDVENNFFLKHWGNRSNSRLPLELDQ